MMPWLLLCYYVLYPLVLHTSAFSPCSYVFKQMGVAISVGLAGGLKFVHDEYGDLKGEIKDVRKEMKEEINGVKKEMKDEISGVKEEVNRTKDEISGVKKIVDLIFEKMNEPRKGVP